MSVRACALSPSPSLSQIAALRVRLSPVIFSPFSLSLSPPHLRVCVFATTPPYFAELKTYRIAQIFEKVNSLDERKRCLLCGKIVCNVRNHYYVHFPGKYACSLCTAVYTRSDTLLMHCRSKHPELNV